MNNRYNISDCFAFAAQSLLASATFPFVQEYVFGVILMQLNAESHIQQLLDQCVSVGRHTHVIWMKPSQQPIRFAWVESVVRPWGQHLPYQCASCGTIFGWTRDKATGTSIVFFCTGRTKDNRPCMKHIEIFNKFNLLPVKKGHMGTWMQGAITL
jgi:hypothetical protein